MKRTLLLTLLFAVTAFAGCVDDEGADTDGMTDEGDNAAPIDEGLTVDSIVDAPEWAIGDHFGHHIFFGSEDKSGEHIDAVIVDEAGGDWILATDNQEAAKWEAAWDFPMLGAVAKEDLSTTAFGSDWILYDFPLQDGKTWTGTFDPLFNGPRELTLTATFDPAIPTIGQGKKEGFRIEGVNADGAVELMTDYIPEIGWYSELTYVDRTTAPDATDDDFVIRVWGMGQGSDWEGTIVDAAATELVNENQCFAIGGFDPITGAGCPTIAVNRIFEVSEESSLVYGAYFLLAIAGQSRIDLIEPSNTPFSHDRAVQSTGLDDVELVFDFYEIEDPASGQWTYTWQGEGFVAVVYTQLWELQFTETAFPAS